MNHKIMILISTSLFGLFTLTACTDNTKNNDSTESSLIESSDSSAAASDSSAVHGSFFESFEEDSAMEETFDAVIVSQNKEHLTIARKSDGSGLYRLIIEEDKIYDGNEERVSVDELKDGTIISITFNGIVGHSYPAFIPNYSKIIVTEETDNATLKEAKETLGSLTVPTTETE